MMICNYVYEHVEDNTTLTVRYTNVFPKTACSTGPMWATSARTRTS